MYLYTVGSGHYGEWVDKAKFLGIKLVIKSRAEKTYIVMY